METDMITGKQFRIYRLINKDGVCNSFLKYFDTLKDAQKSPKRDKWGCIKISIEALVNDKWHIQRND